MIKDTFTPDPVAPTETRSARLYSHWFFFVLLALCLGVASRLTSRAAFADRSGAVQTRQLGVSATPGVLQISLASKDLVYSQSNQRIYASVPANAPSFANSLVPINVANGAMESAIAIGSDPDRLAISDNGRYVYADLNGSDSIRRYDVSSQTLAPEFSLGISDRGVPLQAEDLKVLPGQPDSLAISLQDSLDYRAVAIYDSGAQRPAKTPRGQINNRIEFGSSASILYGAETETTGYFRKMSIDNDGVHLVSVTARASGHSAFKFSQGLVYQNNGAVYDPEARAFVGRFPTSIGLVVPDTSNNRVYFVITNGNGATILAFDTRTFLPIASLTVSEGSGQIVTAIPCGTGMLAYSTSNGQILLVHTATLQPISPTSLPLPSVGADGVVKLQLAVNDLIFDQSTQKVYASISGSTGSFGNSIAPIDPMTGNMSQPVFIGSDPTKLAVSDNNQYLYAGLDGAAAVRRFDLQSQTAGMQFPLGFDDFNGAFYVKDMEVQPGNPAVVAIARRNNAVTPDFEGVAIYDNGVRRPNVTHSHTGSDAIEFAGNPSVLYGLSSALEKLSVDSSGVSVLSSTSLIFEPRDFRIDNGLIYANNGQVADPETASLLGAFPVTSLVAPVLFSDRAYLVSWSPLSPSVTIYAFERQTFLPVGFLTIANVSGKPGSFIRWGTDGLAFRTSGNQVFFLRTSALHPYSTTTPIFTTRADGIRQLSLLANDIVYNPADQLIYASVPSAAGTIGNSITPIDPVAGSVGQSVFIGSEPNKLALSDTGETLYTTLGGAPAVRRFNVAAKTAGMQFGLGSDSGNGPFYGEDLAVAPGNPDLVAVSTYLLPVLGYAGVVLTSNGIPLPNKAAGNTLAFLGPYLYTLKNDSSEFGLRKLALNSDGLSQVDFTTHLVNGFVIQGVNGRIYGSEGSVVDGDTFTLMGNFSRTSTDWFAPDPANNRVYFITSNIVQTAVSITAYDTSSFLQVGSLTIQNVKSPQEQAKRLIRFGADGLAFKTTGGKIYFLSTSMITPLPVTPIPTPVQVTPEIRQYSLSTGDLVYNRADGMIYASVPSRKHDSGGMVPDPISFGNSIVPINPVTGTLGQPVWAGSEPKKLAISGNGRYIYVGLDGGSAVSRLDVASQTIGGRFALGNSWRGPRFVDDMEVAPGSASTLAISLMHKNGSPRYLKVAIYDDGIQRPVATEEGLFQPPFELTNAIEFAKSPATIYGYNLESSSEDFHKLAVSSAGVEFVSDVRNLFHATDIKFDNGLIYSTSGQVVNPETATVVGTYTGLGNGDHLVLPESATGSVFFLVNNLNGTATIRAYNQTSFALTGTLTIPGINGRIGSFIRWGANGFAFRTDDHLGQGNQLFIIQSSSLVPPAITNPIDDARAFVRQHYLDFLNRNPDQAGWDYWTDKITQCGIDAYCIHTQRIGVSAAFFIELEFQQTGYVVYRFYRAAYGVRANAPTRADISFQQFIADRAQLVGGSGLPQNTINLANSFVARPEFKTRYPDDGTMTNAQFVNKLFDTSNLTPYTAERQQQIDAMNNNGKTRAQVLLDVIEINEFKTREYNPAFVLMQYYGYLRRNPDQGGYDFWLNVLDVQPNNFRGMVCSFLTSTEYQQRFGIGITRSNQDCSQ
jgi:hypothetical protein